MNSIAAGLSLFLFWKILIKLKVDAYSSLVLAGFCASCFGFMRFAGDAETYILPLLFSLISTYIYIRNTNYAHCLLSGLFAAIAVLIHQVHIWWTLAILVSIVVEKPFLLRKATAYTLPLLLIPFIYFIVYLKLDSDFGFMEFVTGEYGKGNAGIDLSLKSIVLTLINLCRTVFQVHGNFPYLISEFPLAAMGLVLLCLFLLTISIGLYRKHRISFTSIKTQGIHTAMAIAFILHLAFATLSSGNAEFMVMLPFLAVMYICSSYSFDLKPNAAILVCTLFIWNAGSGIIPNAFLKINTMEKQTEIVLSNGNAYFLSEQKPLLENIITYKKGFHYTNKILKPSENVKANNLLNEGKIMFTDIFNAPKVYSRKSMLGTDIPKDIFSNSEIEKYDSFENLYGKNYIWKIQALK